MNPERFHGYYWLVLLSLILYVPLILLGGFGTSDDLSLVAHIGSDYWKDLEYSLSRSGHISRPIYGIIQTTLLHLFGKSFLLYNICRLALWAVLIYAAHIVFKKSVGRRNGLLFLFFLSFPIFASSQLFNAMQTGYLLSIIFFLLALRSIQKENVKWAFRFYFIYFFWSLLALLACEIVFPLFLFPLLQLWSNSDRRFRNILFSTGLVFGLVLILKFVIGPNYQIGNAIYGFSFSMHSFLQGVYYFFTLFIELPLLLFEVIPFYFSEPLLWLSLLVIPLVYWSKSGSSKRLGRSTFINTLITIFACSAIFILSNYPAVTYGLYNKMLLPSHLFVCLALAIICAWLLHSRLYVIPYVVAVLWFASMEMQVINSIRSWNKRTEVYADLVPLLDDANTVDYVFVEVPYFLNSNYNNEPVFSLIEDFQGGLILNGYQGMEENISPFTARMKEDSLYWPNHNIVNVIRTKKIDNFFCISASKKAPHYFDTKLRNTNASEFIVSDDFSSQKECLREQLRSYISKIFK